MNFYREKDKIINIGSSLHHQMKPLWL
jgi:hypothetical protein